MRNKLIPLTLALSTIPFAFYRMEGPFYYGTALELEQNQDQTPVQPMTEELIDLCSKSPNSLNEEDRNKLPVGQTFLFNYEPYTKYVLMASITKIADQVKILQGDVNLTDNNDLNLQFYCFKRPLQKVSDNSYLADNVYDMALDTYDKWDPDKTKRPSSWYDVPLTKSFTTSSGFVVTNKDNIDYKDYMFPSRVEVFKQDGLAEGQASTENIERALRGYFNIYIDNSNDNIIKESYKQQLKSLIQSEILTVCGVIKGEDDKESIIGTARDVKSDKKFFWITELKDDFSTLFNRSNLSE